MSDTWLENISSQPVACLLILWSVSLVEQKFKIFMKFQFISFFSYKLCFGIISKSSSILDFSSRLLKKSQRKWAKLILIIYLI